MKEHSTSEVVIKKAKVDKKIIPVVKWLNTFNSVFTKWSCQGDSKGINLPWLGPYVVFCCDQQMDLIAIVNYIGYNGTVEVRPSDGFRGLDFCLRFHSQKNLELFIKTLSNKPC